MFRHWKVTSSLIIIKLLLLYFAQINSGDLLTCSRSSPTAHRKCFLFFQIHSNTFDIRKHTRRTSRGFFLAIPALAPVARLRPAFCGEKFQSCQEYFVVHCSLLGCEPAVHTSEQCVRLDINPVDGTLLRHGGPEGTKMWERTESSCLPVKYVKQKVVNITWRRLVS